MAEDIVIVDKNGDEHHFPAGMDPKKAAGIVRKKLGMPDAAPESVTVTPPKQTQGNPGGNIPIAGWQPKGTFDTTEEDTTGGKVAQSLSLASVDPLTGLGAPVDSMFGSQAAKLASKIPFRSIASGALNKASSALDYVLPSWATPKKSILEKIATTIGETPKQMPKGYYGNMPPTPEKPPIFGSYDLNPKPSTTPANPAAASGLERVPYSPSTVPAGSDVPDIEGFSRYEVGTPKPAQTNPVAGMPGPDTSLNRVPYSAPNPSAPAPRGSRAMASTTNNAGGRLVPGQTRPAEQELSNALETLMGQEAPPPASVELPSAPDKMTAGGRPAVPTADLNIDPSLAAAGREAGAPLSTYAPEPSAPAEVGTLTGRTAPAPEDELQKVLADMLTPQGPEAVSMAPGADVAGEGAFRQSGTFGKSGQRGQPGGYTSGQPTNSTVESTPLTQPRRFMGKGMDYYRPESQRAGYVGETSAPEPKAYSSADAADPAMSASPEDLGMGNELPLPPDSGTGAATAQPVTSLAEPATAAPAADNPTIMQDLRDVVGHKDAAALTGTPQRDVLAATDNMRPRALPTAVRERIAQRLGELSPEGQQLYLDSAPNDMTAAFIRELMKHQ